MNFIFTVNWIDQTGILRSKVYQNDDQARRAVAWLEARGAENCEIIVKPKIDLGIES